MAELNAELIWQDGVHFLGTAPSGHQVHLDGDKVSGSSPMELILLGLGGCASYDVVSIMKKSRQEIADVRCQMRAVRADTVPAVFTDIHLHFFVTGHDIKEPTLAKAIELSAEKYCSASKMLSAGGVNITHSYEIVAE